MDLQGIIENYGYVAILIGTFLEGETILVLAGLAAHQGYLVLIWVILAAFSGSLCGDQLFFYLGRKHSQVVLSRRPAWKHPGGGWVGRAWSGLPGSGWGERVDRARGNGASRGHVVGGGGLAGRTTADN